MLLNGAEGRQELSDERRKNGVGILLCFAKHGR